MHRLGHIDTWIFDLDNTLYPARSNLFAQIDVKMGRYISDLLGVDAEAARVVQKNYFHSHGMTLRGLMDEHAVDPHHFLDFVHNIDVSLIEHDARLVESIAALPGRKLVFTNADIPYAARVLDRLGLAHAFEVIHDIHATGYLPKPDPRAYAGLCDAYAIDPKRALFAEDMARNLPPAHAIGMTTVWINNGSEQGPGTDLAQFIDFEISDLSDWLHAVVATLETNA
ncbi:pyrimidine 5'-nucleotidase [Polymorphobacter arshaanensis]|uniref:Pyrimidine 5'-nucleotidase n=1 Tax=Glacieibacterium arshaanense TaxID=2511025 RepID=A0A4Y9ELJ8_9SPHN|nr:pyrimidine 5'-nucleotidase [Polymorphobacter arshaanensis]TFU01316.1 pyrimidine 5'-nucleotidase [Polymorphobacter arshaanensis]